MIRYKTEEEIELIRQSSLLVGKTLAEVARHMKAGVKTKTLDQIAESFIRDHNAIPGFKGYGGFPATLCISVNEVVVHGIPGDYVIKEGDLVSIDCGVIIDGYYGDSAYSFMIEPVAKEVRLLAQRTKESLYKGIEQATAGNRLGNVGYAVQSYVESFGYSVVRDLVGHGVGRDLHEKPEVPNYGRQGIGLKLQENLVIAIEPMINLGTRQIFQERDGWTIRTADRRPSAHYEHTIVVRKGNAEVLSTFEYIEDVINKSN
ncbi:MAG: type I methionyl aminopeptidase [Bacteroidales bacterium]|nr:type I methionyl aminopeptidase [Bacteroidales bacterium]